MKYSLPLFATCSLTVLVWASCSTPDSDMHGGTSGYEAAPAPAENASTDTATYNRNRGGDTLNSTLHPMPKLQDSTSSTPPQP